MPPVKTSLPPETVPTTPAARREWIKYQLRVRGLSLAKVAARHHKSPKTIQKALDTPYKKSERFIAAALQLRPAQLWPERFDSRGQRIRKKPGRKPRIEQHMDRAA